MERVEIRARCPTCSGWVMKKRAKPEEEVAGDGALGGVGITKRPKPKPDEDKEMVADAEAKEERTKKVLSPKPEKKMVADAGAKEEKTKEKRTKEKLSPKPDEKEMVADTGSEEDSKSMAQPAGCRKRRTKMVLRRLSKVFLEDLLNYPPSPPYQNLPVDDCDYLVRTMAREMAAAEKDSRDFNAFLLDQYRSYGYAEIPEEVTDDEEEV